eukprot:m.1671411 g.1671411  ORF g.1671411 m.1671411 type:complete len:67 (+) comp170296_c0_seq1:27-227(+)
MCMCGCGFEPVGICVCVLGMGLCMCMGVYVYVCVRGCIEDAATVHATDLSSSPTSCTSWFCGSLHS